MQAGRLCMIREESIPAIKGYGLLWPQRSCSAVQPFPAAGSWPQAGFALSSNRGVGWLLQPAESLCYESVPRADSSRLLNLSLTTVW